MLTKIKIKFDMNDDNAMELIREIISSLRSTKKEMNQIEILEVDKKEDVHLVNIDEVGKIDGQSDKIYFYNQSLKTDRIQKIGNEFPIPLGLFCIDKFKKIGIEYTEIARFEKVLKDAFRKRLYDSQMEKSITKALNWKVELNREFIHQSNSQVSLLSDPSMREVMLHTNRIADSLKEESDNMLLLRNDVQKTLDNITGITGSDEVNDVRSFVESLYELNCETIHKRHVDRIPSILIEGSTGTGKTLIARYIGTKLLSEKYEECFSKISLVNLSKDTIDIDLFGCVPGSFTGSRIQTGKMIANYGGVLFLDEIGDIPIEIQTKLLTYMDDMSVPMTGYVAPKPIKVPMILIAATNRNLKYEVMSGHFREDLYHRFTYKIHLPDLTDRKEDFRFLLSFALQKMNRKSKIKTISICAIEYLEKQAFPGNFRELESRCSRAISLAEIAGRDVLLKADFEDY